MSQLLTLRFLITLSSFTCTAVASSVEDAEKKEFSPKRLERFIIIHGMLAVFAWGLLAPAAIIASAIRRRLPGTSSDRENKDVNPTNKEVESWFRIHKYLNMFVYILTIMAFFLAKSALQKNGEKHFTMEPTWGVAKAHKLFGLIFLLLLSVQVVSGICRPFNHAPVSADENVTSTESDPELAVASKGCTKKIKKNSRSLWRYGHRIFGILLMVGSLYQILSGLFLYNRKGYSSSWYHTMMWIYVFSLVCPLLLLLIFRKRKQEA